MKKVVFMVIVIGMLGWAVFDFVSSSDDTAVEEDTMSGNSTNSLKTEKFTEGLESDEIGLERGEIAPDFELTTLAGDTVNLSDFRGERVFLNFWATWCPPCRAEMPDMQKLYEEEDVVILAVNMTASESNEEVVDEFVKDLELTFPIPLDVNGSLLDEYQVVAYPTTYMIDSSGRTQFKSMGAMNHEQMLQQLEAMY